MTPEQFAYWLNGFVEMTPNGQPSPQQWEMIKAHLQTVFHKVTPMPAVRPQTDLSISELMQKLQDSREKAWGPQAPNLSNPNFIC